MSGPGPTGRLDALGPATARARGVAGVVRTGASAVSGRVRRALREPVALRDARRAELTRLARSAASDRAVGPGATPAVDAAVTAWLADPGPMTGALLSQVQGRFRAPAEPVDHPGTPDAALVGVPLDEAQHLESLLSALGRTRTGADT